MKKLLFIILFAALGCAMLQAREYVSVKKIQWKRQTSTRAPQITPLELSHERNIVYIYANMNIENLEIEVKDVSGRIVYSNLVGIEAYEEYAFTLEDVLSGEYTIEIRSGENYIIGCFML